MNESISVIIPAYNADRYVAEAIDSILAQSYQRLLDATLFYEGAYGSMQVFILGGGITGLSVGSTSGLPVFEAIEIPGGICSSYDVRPNSQEKLGFSSRGYYSFTKKCAGVM